MMKNIAEPVTIALGQFLRQRGKNLLSVIGALPLLANY